MSTAIILDCDTGIDDSLALLHLLQHPEAELVAVLSTAGNVGVEAVTRNNLSWLEFCGRGDIGVHVGASAPLAIPLHTCEETHGEHGLGHAQLPAPTVEPQDEDAAAAWGRLTRERPGELVGLVIGPLTNLALAIRQDPDLPRRLQRLVVMGGSVDHPGNTTPLAEWNIAVDPEAAHEVFTAFGVRGAPQPIICALQLTEQIAFTPQHLSRLTELSDGPLVKHLADALRFYFEFHQEQGEGYLAHVHDAFAAAVALDPSIVTTTPAVVDVELTGTLTRGAMVADRRGFWGRPPNALIAETTDVPQFFDELIRSLAALAERHPGPTGTAHRLQG